MSASALARLQSWYRAQCNGDWEHQQGIAIGTLDNPGWTLKIELSGTQWEKLPFAELKLSYEHSADWMIASKQASIFEAACGPEKLEQAIDIFIRWTESTSR